MEQSKCIYSVYIRTLGKGGDKYQRLLDSIKKQTIQPLEVVVVLPYGYKKPKERLGYERFAYSEKGMVRQRLFAIDDAKIPYILLLDDDVEFEAFYIEKLFDTMQKAKAQCCIPILKDNSLRDSVLKRLINRFIGSVIYKDTKDEFYMRINFFAGFIINTNVLSHKQYYTQTGHGSNCFIESYAIKSIHFEEELWLEESGYSLPDDQVMFYKIYRSGYKIAVCQDAYFCHLDASSTDDGQRQLRIAQAKAGNFLIFWYRFIYQNLSGIQRFKSVFCITHRLFWECVLYILLKCHSMKSVRYALNGLKFGFHYIKTYKENAK